MYCTTEQTDVHFGWTRVAWFTSTTRICFTVTTANSWCGKGPTLVPIWPLPNCLNLDFLNWTGFLVLVCLLYLLLLWWNWQTWKRWRNQLHHGHRHLALLSSNSLNSSNSSSFCSWCTFANFSSLSCLAKAILTFKAAFSFWSSYLSILVWDSELVVDRPLCLLILLLFEPLELVEQDSNVACSKYFISSITSLSKFLHSLCTCSQMALTETISWPWATSLISGYKSSNSLPST